MKRILLTSVLVPFGLAIGVGCAVDDTSTTPGQVNGNAGDKAAGAGGNDTTGAAGSMTTTGNMGGGMTTGGGDVGMGGMGQAGTPANGGAAGVAMAGAAGMGGGAGGAPGMIGEGMSDYGFKWKDSWWISGCQTKAGHDCITINTCPNGGAANFEDRGAVTVETFPIGGTPGTMYNVTFQVNGISEGKVYMAGTRDAGQAVPANINSADLDTFHQDGTSIVSNYNVIKMTIMDSAKKEVKHYYLNSFPAAAGAESHRTFHLSYSKTIMGVPGGGFVQYLAEDSNCHAIDNCGDGDVSDTVCTAARGIPHEEANPLPAMGIDPNPANDVAGKHKAVALATLNSVNGATKPWHSQIIHLTITKAVAQ